MGGDEQAANQLGQSLSDLAKQGDLIPYLKKLASLMENMSNNTSEKNLKDIILINFSQHLPKGSFHQEHTLRNGGKIDIYVNLASKRYLIELKVNKSLKEAMK